MNGKENGNRPPTIFGLKVALFMALYCMFGACMSEENLKTQL